jgi:small subunit ribosomal protein S20
LITKGSAAKRHRQSEKQRVHNRVIRSRVRTSVRRVLAAVDENDRDAAQSAFLEFSSLIDSAARKGVYHRNNAARKKSRMAKKVNAIGG